MASKSFVVAFTSQGRSARHFPQRGRPCAVTETRLVVWQLRQAMSVDEAMDSSFGRGNERYGIPSTQSKSRMSCVPIGRHRWLGHDEHRDVGELEKVFGLAAHIGLARTPHV